MFNYLYDFSVVMGYYNRREQIMNTLGMFERLYQNDNYEVVIVDDNSSYEHDLTDIINNYSFSINYIKITKEEKGDRINPCKSYNIGFKHALGKIVVIQNPECIHVGNLFNCLRRQLTRDKYLTFSCYNCNSKILTQHLLNDICLIDNASFEYANLSAGGSIWYNHPTKRPVSCRNYHFCSAIYNDNLKLLHGFNEEFSKGHSYDDNELLLSITHNLRIDIECLDVINGFVIHQWHARDIDANLDPFIKHMKVITNERLYVHYLNEHQRYNFKFPKLLHIYCDALNPIDIQSIMSFNKYNIGWKINVYSPPNYMDNVKNIFINITNLRIHVYDVNIYKYLSVFISYVINHFGGLWSDGNIEYHTNIAEYCSNLQTSDIIMFKQTNGGNKKMILSVFNNPIIPVNCSDLFTINDKRLIIDDIYLNSI